ncbi:MAG: putative peptidoglycan glycosyltransferase FtsW [Candidatus Paceibacterota bacterium]
MATPKSIDRIMLGIVLILVSVGFFIFSSASLGLLARDGASFSSVAFTQIVLGIGGGFMAMFIMSRVHYRIWRRFAFYIFLFAICLSLLVFIPGIGIEHAGARRWISVAGLSFQPTEVLKIAFVIYMATWFSIKHHFKDDFWHSIMPFLVSVLAVGAVVLMQRDTDTFLIMVAAGATMFFVRTGRWKDLLAIAVAGLVLLVILASVHDYVRLRLMSFADPGLDPQGVGYQINQSLIAVGSGGLYGRGFGQSVQKFEYLPEPIGDSIFAVFAEEFGFVGTLILLLLFSAFAFRGYRLASRAPDDFGMLLVIGLITLITLQAFLHIAAMIKLAPILGLPLPFISHGGTAMLATLASVGIILNVSKYQKKTSKIG